MKFQLGEIRNMKDPMTILLEKDIPIKVAWNLTKLVKKFDIELGEIENFRVMLVQKFGDKNDNGEVKVPPDKMDEFVNELNEVLGTEVEIDFTPISIDEFGDLHLSTKDLLSLDKIFI